MSKASEYEHARLEAERRYPPVLRLRSVYNSGADYDATASVGREKRCEIRFYHSASELSVSREEAIRLAAWLTDTFTDGPPAGEEA